MHGCWARGKSSCIGTLFCCPNANNLIAVQLVGRKDVFSAACCVQRVPAGCIMLLKYNLRLCISVKQLKHNCCKADFIAMLYLEIGCYSCTAGSKNHFSLLQCLQKLHIDLGGSASPILLPKAIGITFGMFFFFSCSRHSHIAGVQPAEHSSVHKAMRLQQQ